MKTTDEVSKSLLFAENSDYVAGLVNKPVSKQDIVNHFEVSMLQQDIYSPIKKKLTKTLVEGFGLITFGVMPFLALFRNVFVIRSWLSIQGFAILVVCIFSFSCLFAGAYILIQTLKAIHKFENKADHMYDLLTLLGKIKFGKCVDIIVAGEYWLVKYTLENEIQQSRKVVIYNLDYFLHTNKTIAKGDKVVCLFADENLNCIL